MSDVTIGAFLVEKVHNMANWLRAEGLDTQDLLLLQEVQVVALAQALNEKFAQSIEARDFEPLLADKENIPLNVLKAVVYIQERAPLQDKFWRYLKLFSDTVVTAQ